jgi:hypothetical protein
MLLIYSNCIIHCLEGSQKVTFAFMNEMIKNPTFKENKVLYFVDDVVRVFPFWSSRIVDRKGGGGKEGIENFNISKANDEILCKVISDTVFMMISIGQYLANIKDGDLKTALDELAKKYKHMIPTQDVVIALTECDDILNSNEWHSLYATEHKLLLEEELVWPVTKPIA